MFVDGPAAPPDAHDGHRALTCARIALWFVWIRVLDILCVRGKFWVHNIQAVYNYNLCFCAAIPVLSIER